MDGFVLEDFLPYQLAVLAGRASAGFSAAYSEKFGISVPEWRIVAHLSQVEKISIREIYRQVEIDKSKASRAAARLENEGYVTKKVNALDRRLVEVSLTEKGRAMVAEIVPLARRFEGDFLAALSPDERQALRGILGKLTGI